MNLFKVIVTGTLFILTACASTTEKKIESDIAQQPERTTYQAAESGRRAIQRSEKLNFEQKQKMLSLMDRTQAEMVSIQKSEAQVKSSLFKYLAEGKFEDREISTYRKDLQKLENKKMNLMFSNIAETRKILGKDMKWDPELMDLRQIRAEGY